mgnify:CR=1 FL=1
MTDNTELLQSIYKLVLCMNDKIDNLESRIDILDEKMNNYISAIDKKIESKNVKNMPIRNFTKEKFDLDDTVVKKILERASIGGDYDLFKLMYLNVDKELYPITCVSNEYCYWINGFHKDVDCEHIKSIISSNLRHCYFKINKYDESKENSDKFIKNQEHIDKLKDDKYLMKLIEYIYKKL